MINRSREANQQYGFFVPALVTVFLVVIFIALLFGSKLLKKSEPIEVQFSARYHELKAKEHLTEEESAEFELERCRFDRDLVNYIEKNDPSRFDHAKANYETRCQDKLPL